MPFNNLIDMIRVAIADDHNRVRQAWAFILSRNPDISIVAECTNGEEAIQAVKDHSPDVILMDINMEPMDGIRAAAEITKHNPSTRVIGMSIHNDLSYVNRMLKVGASGYVTKNSPSHEMITAIQHVSRGEQYLCSEVRALAANFEPRAASS